MAEIDGGDEDLFSRYGRKSTASSAMSVTCIFFQCLKPGIWSYDWKILACKSCNQFPSEYRSNVQLVSEAARQIEADSL